MSQLGHETMRAARGARIAIFNGNTDMAAKLVGVALTDLKAAEKDAGVVMAFLLSRTQLTLAVTILLMTGLFQ